ncbi:MAG: hypothetical protein WCX65_12825 [bacterium]
MKINLVVSDEQLLIYAGANQGLKVGNKYSVVRDGETIGVIEITEVKERFSVAKIVSKTKDLQDMDNIVPAGAAAAKAEPAAKKESAAPKAAAAPAAAPAAAAPETSPAAESKATSKRRSSKVDESASAEKPADAAPAEAPAEAAAAPKRTSRRGGGSTAAPAADSEAAAAPADTADAPKRTSRRGGAASTDDSSEADGAAADTKADAKKKDDAKAGGKKAISKDPREINFATTEDGTGLWTVPTSRILDKGRAAISYYKSDYSLSYTEQRNDEYTSSEAGSLNMSSKALSLVYGVGNNIEVFASDVKDSANLSLTLDGYTATANGSAKGRVYGLKYKPGKRVILKKDTSKKWTYAVGAERTKYGDVNGSKFYAVADFPYPKFDVHGSLFQINRNGIRGKRLGTQAAIEFVVTPRVLLLSEVTLFQSQYTYNVAMRYIYQGQGALTLGLNDVTDMQIKTIGFSYLY